MVAGIDVLGARRAARTMPMETAVAIVEAEALALLERRIRRQPHGGRVTVQCPACCRFVRSLAQRCSSCGYLDGAGYAR